MKNFKRISKVIFIAFLLVGGVIVWGQSSSQNQVRKLVRLANTPLFMDANEKVVTATLQAKSATFINNAENKSN